MHKFLAKSLFIGKPVIIVPYCHSTNDIAAEMGSKGELLEGGVISTPNQTKGRGQRGNVWESEPGMNLTFSIFLSPGFISVKEQFHLHFVASLGILDFLHELISEGISIKWPNDIYFNDQKLGGILIENSLRRDKLESSVIGIGLNINQSQFEIKRATSLKRILKRELDLDWSLEELLIRIERRYIELKQGKNQELRSDYLENLYWKNENHSFRRQGGEQFEGIITGIEGSGKLQINVGSETQSFDFKEIEFMR